MDQSKAQKALEIVRELVKTAESATDLHNAFFGIGGEFGKLFPTRTEREAYAKTPKYEEIVRIRVEMKERERAVS